MKDMRNMGTKSLCISKFISMLIIYLSSNSQIVLATHKSSSTTTTNTNRKALEVGLGDGGIIIGGSPTPESSPTNCSPPPPPPPPPPPCPPPPRPQEPRVDIAKRAILEFKKRVIIDPMGITNSWVQGRNACDYTGFSCAFLHQHGESGLYGVEFNGFGFDGPNLGIDKFIENLPDVSLFHANGNNFKGNVPDLSKLPKFFELDLSNNKYCGGFPKNLLGVSQLSFLDIRFNTFTGLVPPQLFTMDLIALFINNNNFEQNLPSNLGSTPVNFLTLANNKFTGSIPKSIGQTAKTLQQILLLNNQLTGCLPYEIGLLKNAEVFDAGQNQLTGPIPHSFACLAETQYLILDKNQLYGQVPELVCKLPKLVNLTLSNNYFTQVGPECMKLIRKGVLDVKMNCVLGLPYQKPAEECAWFFNKPKYCPDSNMNNYVPCKGTAKYLDLEVDTASVPVPRAALTYDALSPKPRT